MPSVSVPINHQKYLQRHSDNGPVVHVLHGVPDEDRALIFRVEAVKRGQRAAYVVFNFFELSAFVADPYAVKIIGVFQVACRGEGDVNNLVDIIIAFLHLGREHADHLKAHTLQANAFADRGLAGEEFVFGVRADHCYPGALHFIFRVKKLPSATSMARMYWICE